ncbi:hypothetical protein CCHL11_05019 [Colletotrichum chlorophyti]|uniref:Uncharacterized protein n=1 Tax=Colletotrichum chlorophyti TaxID=708187 RepID=A0A1Q8S364_9PEZI|nr:hypothetical protein CCHL11_05019 [Colletotrichum chlorophyti]
MASNEKVSALEGGVAKSSGDRSLQRDPFCRARQRLRYGEHESKTGLEEAPRRRRIRSSRASRGPKAPLLTSSGYLGAQHVIAAHGLTNDTRHLPSIDKNSTVCRSFSAAHTQSRFHLTPESDEDVKPSQIRSEALPDGCETRLTDVPGDRPSSRHKLHVFRSQNDAVEPEIPVHLDDNNDGYYCCSCGIRRSDEQHKIRKFRARSPVWRNLCKPCHEKHLATGNYKRIKMLGHFCFDCGFARSSHFNKEHPVKRGQKPAKNLCAHCMKRMSERAVIPAETLLGCSSDERDSDLDENDSDDGDLSERVPVQTLERPAIIREAEAGHNGAISTEARELSSVLVQSSFPEPVQAKLDEYKFDHKNKSTHMEHNQLKYQVPTSSKDEVVVSVSSSTNRTPVVKDAYGARMTEQDDDKDYQKTLRRCDSPVLSNPMIVPVVHVTPTSHTKPGEVGLEPESLLSTHSNSPSKRATFNERVEVRTSPTYWQREHSDSDDSYTNFEHEQYHEDLGDGKKAVPLKDPLIDPNGYSAKRLHVPRPYLSVDDESFYSWSRPDTGQDLPGFGYTPRYTPSTNNSNLSQPHLSSLYTPDKYQTKDQPRCCTDRHGERFTEFASNDQGCFDEARPNPNNRQSHPYNGRTNRCTEGKENQACPYSPVIPESRTPYSSFGDHRIFEPSSGDWTSQHSSSSCTDRTGSSWHSQTYGSNWTARVDGYSDLHGSYHGASAHPHKDFNTEPYATFSNKGQDPFSSDQSFHQPSSNATFSHQHQSRAQKEHWSDEDRETCESFTDSHAKVDRDGPDNAAGWNTNAQHDAACTTDAFEYSKDDEDTSPLVYEHKLPPTGFAMEIPEDMSDSDVHDLFIPGYDEYVPWRKQTSV